MPKGDHNYVQPNTRGPSNQKSHVLPGTMSFGSSASTKSGINMPQIASSGAAQGSVDSVQPSSGGDVGKISLKEDRDSKRPSKT